MVEVGTLIGFGLLAGLGMFIIIIGLALYVYMSLAFMSIAKKAKYHAPGIAWIPAFGPTIIANGISGMPKWPFFLILGILIPGINILAGLVFIVFSIMWFWKTFEAVHRPGWWALVPLVPMLGSILFFILIGIAAWGKK